MIRIDRSGVKSSLNPELVAATKARLAEFYNQPADVRRKQRLESGERLPILLDGIRALN